MQFRNRAILAFVCVASVSGWTHAARAAEPGIASERPAYSGIYPHLAYFNREDECGTGAVVPWAGKLWVITYGPHCPGNSSDKLYEIDENLNIRIRPESVGGTNANRMIHRESEQLLIGAHAIDKHGKVRTIPRDVLRGRLTGIARHLTDPQHKVYYATMEEGFYEVDVDTLAVKELYRDGNFLGSKDVGNPLLPGYHGKGLYSGQGRLIYANNGEYSRQARGTFDIPSGVLAEWNGIDWRVIQRKQFTDVRGPGGIYGNENPASDPVWAIGWDTRSLILMTLDGGEWHSFRLPKASNSYDGAHGWHTEWPRFGDIGEDDFLLTMHGMFWRFPKRFSLAQRAGIRPRSTYLKIVGDFTRWGDYVVMGCDDAAKSGFLNRHGAALHGDVAGPGLSHSNLWFVKPEQLDQFGTPLGRGGVWLNDTVKANEPSESYLFAGWKRRAAHFAHTSNGPVKFSLEVDLAGDGRWTPLRDVNVPAGGYTWVEFSPDQPGEWVRVRIDKPAEQATAWFTFSNDDPRETKPAALCDGLARESEPAWSGGILHAGADEKLKLQFAAARVENNTVVAEGYYEMTDDMRLKKVDAPEAQQWVREHVSPPKHPPIGVDAASVYVTDADSGGRRFRLPKGVDALNAASPIPIRYAREVATERDLLQLHGTFYELPSRSSGGFARIRPIASSDRRITDFCSWRGLLVLSGVSAVTGEGNPHIIRADDNQAAVWVGAIDDLWQFGKAVGQGGPWKDSAVKANEPSDAYLMAGYDHKRVELSHDASEPVEVRVEVDLTGDGQWQLYEAFKIPAGETLKRTFSDAFQPYWVRTVANRDCHATAWFIYD